jgi:hypothetical protein
LPRKAAAHTCIYSLRRPSLFTVPPRSLTFIAARSPEAALLSAYLPARKKDRKGTVKEWE